jgi:hypothetical protein
LKNWTIKDMPDFVNNLAQLIVTDNAILLVGGRFRLAADQPLFIDQIAEALAVQIDYKREDRSLSAVARDFEVLRGRRELVLAIRETMENLGARSTPLLQLLADAVVPYSKVITSLFDQTLERSFDGSGKPYVLIVRDTDLTSFDESKITLIKIQGSIEQPDSLIITEDDIDQFIERLPTLSDLIRAYFATKALIFIGYDLESDLFKRFFRQVARKMGAFSRSAYAIVSEPLDEVTTRYWEQQNVELHHQDPLAFLEEVAQTIHNLTGTPEGQPIHPLAKLAAADPPLPTRPYKGLESFTPADSPIFAGREIESERLVNRILANRLVVVYGGSGSGKTSLLQAGVLSRLAARRALLVDLSPNPDVPLPAGIEAGLEDAAKAAGLVPTTAGELPGKLRAYQQAIDGPVVVVLDPFEQVLVNYTPEIQAGFLADLKALLAEENLDLRVVLVLREDFLGQVHELEQQVPGLLDVRFRLEKLGREAAREAIIEPARAFGVRWEAALVETLLDALEQERAEGISPPQLQLLCDRLYTAARAEASSPGSDDSLEITAALYDRLGGAPRILGEYLDEVIGSFSPEQRSAVMRLLGALVTSAGTKQRLGLEDLARTAGTNIQEAQLILEGLAARSLIQRYEQVGKPEGPAAYQYELVHDYLALRIIETLGADFWEAQKAREVLRAALPDWVSRKRLLGPDDLRLIQSQASRVQFSLPEFELLFASAVAFEENPAPWESELIPASQQEILLRLASHPEPFARREAASALGPLSGDPVSDALARLAAEDKDGEVRQAAAQAIAQSKVDGGAAFDQGAVALLGEAAGEAPEGAAVQALVVARDRTPEIHQALPVGIAGTIRRRVWAARWTRNQRAITAGLLRGLQSGFWGLAFGMGVFLGLYNAGASLSANIAARFYIGAVLLGMSLAGVMGALAVGAGTFFQLALASLQDRPQPVRTWALTALVSGLFFSLGLVLIGAVSAGSPRPGETLLAGLIMGLSIAGAALLPWVKAPYTRLGITALAGIASFILVGLLGLFFNQSIGWLVVMGLGCGVGFYLGLNPRVLPGTDPLQEVV